MVFSSVVFMFLFLPIVLLGHTILWGAATLKAARSGRPASVLLLCCNFFLFICSVFFYAWGGPKHTLLLLVVALVNFLFGLGIARAGAHHNGLRHKKLLLILGVTLNLATLAYFKYFNLFLASGGEGLLRSLLPSSISGSLITTVVLPLGVSFYVFHGICYIVDVYRGDVKATTNPVIFFCYFVMFPPLVAGPIVRYITIADELRDRSLSWDRMRHGAARFILGLAKKVLLADAFALIADAAFSEPAGQLGQAAAWAGIIAYTFQIYFDFSAYSDMAIGLGHMFGFTLPENFNYPYISRNITEFWRRWHMTLSSWFRDYVYIPLGGNRHGPARTILNLFIVFALCGFWHGAAWTFMAWGLYHGTFLAVERLFPRFFKAIPRPVSHLYAILAFSMGWVLFRADSFNHALSYYKSLLGFYPSSPADNSVWLHLFGYDVMFAYVFGAIVAMPVLPWLRNKMLTLPDPLRMAGNGLAHAGLLILLFLAALPIFGSTHIPFIYFRF